MPPRRRSPGVPAASPANPTPPPPPTTSTSLLHSLRAWPVVVWIGSVVVEFDEFHADQWVAALIDEEPIQAIMELLDDEVHDLLVDELIEGRIDARTLEHGLLDVVSLVSGRPWWFTLRLLHAAQGAWDTVGGFMALRGVRAEQLSLQAYMDALLAAVLRHVEPKDQTSMLARLKAPPAGATIAAIDEAREEDVFRAQMRGN